MRKMIDCLHFQTDFEMLCYMKWCHYGYQESKLPKGLVTTNLKTDWRQNTREIPDKRETKFELRQTTTFRRSAKKKIGLSL